ncbi:MAG: vWA domain-containing protein [Streptosporangiaceae bacterium]
MPEHPAPEPPATEHPVPEPPATEPESLVGMLVAFGRELRGAGLGVGTGDAVTYAAALSRLDPADLADLYWAGRAVLVSRRDDIATYDEVFARFFLGEPGVDRPGRPPARQPRASTRSESALVVPDAEPAGPGPGEQALLGLQASDAEVLRHKEFAACTPDELAAVRRMMARIALTPPRRRSRRTQRARRGALVDLRRMVRESMRTQGEPVGLRWRDRKVRLRPLILILDVSGSMADYSRHLLQFAYSARRAATRVEVFCFGTRLTRITRELNRRRPDDALERAAASVVDWAGGTRIGESLRTFVTEWGRRGIARGGIVVICSDGLDRGDPAVLDAAMERLARLSHRIVWVNPHIGGDPGFRPSALGMMIAAPHTDLLLSGHDLDSLEKLAALLPALN